MIDRLLDWLCDRLGFTGLSIADGDDLMTPDWHEGDGDPHYRRPSHVVTPQQHAARLKGRRTQ